MNRPAHPPLYQFPVKDNCLQVGGVALTRLTARIGQTPFYAYDRARITERVQALREALPAGLALHYAIKANPMPAVVQHLATLVDGFDIASRGEMRLALNTPMDASRISIAGPGKSEQELACAIAAGITINLESERELEAVARLAHRQGVRPRVAVRVNPDFELKASGMHMGGGPRPFGIDAERVPAVLGRIGARDLEFAGFHVFSGSQNLNPAAIAEAFTRTVALASRLAAQAPAPVRSLLIGSGFGIPYFPGQRPLDLGPIAQAIAKALEDAERALPEMAIALELGRYLVGEAGVYVCRVVDRKVSRGRIYLITDGGLHHHLAASGNFGQVIRKNFPVVVGNRVHSNTTETVTVVGPLCTPLDLLAEQMELPPAEAGDLIVILQSGAYGLSASPTGFLSHPPPAEVLV